MKLAIYEFLLSILIISLTPQTFQLQCKSCTYDSTNSSIDAVKLKKDFETCVLLQWDASNPPRDCDKYAANHPNKYFPDVCSTRISRRGGRHDNRPQVDIVTVIRNCAKEREYKFLKSTTDECVDLNATVTSHRFCFCKSEECNRDMSGFTFKVTNWGSGQEYIYCHQCKYIKGDPANSDVNCRDAVDSSGSRQVVPAEVKAGVACVTKMVRTGAAAGYEVTEISRDSAIRGSGSGPIDSDGCQTVTNTDLSTTTSCYCQSYDRACNNGYIGSKCLRCQSYDGRDSTCEIGTGKAEFCKNKDGPRSSCASVLTKLNDGRVSVERLCVPYDPNHTKGNTNSKCTKEYVTSGSNVYDAVISCPCFYDGCNTYKKTSLEQIEKDKGRYCQKCKYPTDPLCKDGTTKPQECNIGGDAACVTTISQGAVIENGEMVDLERDDVEISRGCEVRTQKDANVPEECTEVIDQGTSKRKKTCYCFTDNCNKKTPLELDPVTCSSGESGDCSSPGQCKEVTCPTTYLSSCTIKKVFNGHGSYVVRGCTDSYIATPSCKKLYNGYYLSVTCNCNGKHCNKDLKADLVKNTGLWCVQCEYTRSPNSYTENIDCKTNTWGLKPELCSKNGNQDDSAKTCKTLTVKSKEGVVLSVTRGCSELEEEKCDPVVESADGTKTKNCYCKDDWCNREAKRDYAKDDDDERRKCPQCEFVSEPPDVDCNEGKDVPTRCNSLARAWDPVLGSCRTTKYEDRETGKFLGYSRDCAQSTEDGCQPSYHEGNFKKTHCFCNDDGCLAEKSDETAGKHKHSRAPPRVVGAQLCCLLSLLNFIYFLM